MEFSINSQQPKGQNSINFQKYLNIIKKIDEYKLKLFPIEKPKNSNEMEREAGKDNSNENNNIIIKGDISYKMSKY